VSLESSSKVFSGVSTHNRSIKLRLPRDSSAPWYPVRKEVNFVGSAANGPATSIHVIKLTTGEVNSRMHAS
jgi:hypothetical protein